MQTRSLDIEGPAGRLEAVLMSPESPARRGAVLCHAHPLHGGTMHFKLLFRVAKVLQGAGFAVLRFQFRGVGRSDGTHDGGRGEKDDARAALDFLAGELPDTPLVLGGFSFGAAVALPVGLSDDRVAAVLALGLPVALGAGVEARNPAGKPVLFVQGEHDEFGDAEAIRGFVDSFAGPSELVVVPGADHFFGDRLTDVERAVSEWLVRALV